MSQLDASALRAKFLHAKSANDVPRHFLLRSVKVAPNVLRGTRNYAKVLQ